MASVAIATDSTHYLPRALADERGVHQVSLYVGWDGQPERELDMDGFDGFYARLGSDRSLPTTSQPSIGDFLAVWEPLLEAGQDIVAIHLASGISGTYEAARQAHGLLVERGLGDRVEVIDGETACGGLGLLILAACAAANAGADKNAVVARVREARAALEIWFCVDTLEYLRRGGRVGKAQAWIGGTLKIKPILSLEREIVPVERVRTAGRAFERMVGYAQELHDRDSDGWVVQHIQAPDAARRLIERCRELFGSEPVFTSEVGPVIGTYTGPGLIGVGPDPCSAEHQPDHGGAGHQLVLMALHVTAPVSQTCDLAAQPLHGHRQLHAVGLDRAADLRGRALRHQSPSPPGAGAVGAVYALAAPTAPLVVSGWPTVSRILRASSIAMFGTGGEPRLTALAAIRPATTPNTMRITAIAKKP
jgi:DegV family protein with EDD domain